ncbi:hypothetical protein V6N11_067998 [Hibiscus sabdariffa]|uniref:Uncharacterized protein n=1 Tax=Hibiscus sabdariffa TaxID=183260 RepID=A0ABR2SSU2_9ROSI
MGRVKLKKRMNVVHVRDQKHELTPPRNSGNEEVTAFLPRDIVYKQDKQLQDLGISQGCLGGDNGSCPGGYLGGYFRIRQSVVLCYWLIPKSCNFLSRLYTISLGGKAVTFLLPLSQGYLPRKANYCCIFLAAETLLLSIPRRSIGHFLPRWESPASAGNSAIGKKICTILLKSAMAGNLLPRSVDGKSPAHSVGGKICCPDRKSPARGVGGKLPARGVGGIACLGGFTNSAPADVIVAALVGSECYQPGTASVQLPICYRSGKRSRLDQEVHIKLRVVPSISDSIELRCDNNGAIAQAKEPRSYQRSKHILRRFHLKREIIDRGDVEIYKVHTDD